MSMLTYLDGLSSLVSSVTNRRAASARNAFRSVPSVDYVELVAVYESGIGNKIVRIKAAGALDPDDIVFDGKGDREFYEDVLGLLVRDTTRFMLAFGRAIIVLQERGESLSSPLQGTPDMGRLMLRMWSGDMVYTSPGIVDLNSPDYMKPTTYYVRGRPIHRSRVIDFTYVRPTELDLPKYRYGGISEFQLIREQLIADGVVARAVPTILDKASTMVYRVKGFKETLQQKREAELVRFFQVTEDARSVFGATILDAEDDAVAISQSIQGLEAADQVTLRRLAMATGIPLSILVGESVRGMNSTGEKEVAVWNSTKHYLRHDHLKVPLNQLMAKLGKGKIDFAPNQDDAQERATRESVIVATARQLWDMGLDADAYLVENGIQPPDDIDEFFNVED